MALTLRSNLLGRQGHQFSAKASGFTGTLGSEKFLLLTSICWGWDLPGFPWKHHETSTSEYVSAQLLGCIAAKGTVFLFSARAENGDGSHRG